MRAELMLESLSMVVENEPLYRGELKDINGPFFQVVIELIFRLFVNQLDMKKNQGELVLPLTLFDIAMFSLQKKATSKIGNYILKNAVSSVPFGTSSPKQGEASTWSWGDYWDLTKKFATGAKDAAMGAKNAAIGVAMGAGSLATGALKTGWALGKGYWHGSHDMYFDALCTMLRNAPDLKTIVRILLMVIVPALEVIARPKEDADVQPNLLLQRFDELLESATPSAEHRARQTVSLQNLSEEEMEVIVNLRWSNLETTKDRQDTSGFMQELDDLFKRVEDSLNERFLRQEIFEWKVSGGLLSDVKSIKGPVGSAQFAELFLKPLVGKEKYDELKAKEGTMIFPNLVEDDLKTLPPLSDDEFKRFLENNATLVQNNKDYLRGMLSLST